jgi:hypothetical protein
MLVASVIQIVASIAAAFSVNYIMFIFLRFLVAFSVSGVFECGFVLGNSFASFLFMFLIRSDLLSAVIFNNLYWVMGILRFFPGVGLKNR